MASDIRSKLKLSLLLLLFIVNVYGQDTISLALVGDIMPATTFPEPQIPENNGKYLFRDAKPILQSADIALGNLETTLSNSGTPRKQNRDYMFLTPVRYGAILKDAGFKFLSLANNHTLDFGDAGVESTKKCLIDNQIYFSGLRTGSPYSLIVVRGIKIAICAFGFNYYCNQMNNPHDVERIISLAKSKADIVVVSVHGGAEGKDSRHLPRIREFFKGENRGNMREFAHQCIDNGADVVFGHGPHVVRAIELYNGRFIAYSLGNFCTPYGISITQISGYAPIITIDLNKQGQFLGGRIYSFVQKRGVGPRVDNMQRAATEIRQLSDDNIANGAMNITSTGHIVVSEVIPEIIEDEIEEWYDEDDI